MTPSIQHWCVFGNVIETLGKKSKMKSREPWMRFKDSSTLEVNRIW